MPVSKHADERDELLALIEAARHQMSACFSRALDNAGDVEGDSKPDCLDVVEKALGEAERHLCALRDYQTLYREVARLNEVAVAPNVSPIPEAVVDPAVFKAEEADK